jgi:hypothetical protein
MTTSSFSSFPVLGESGNEDGDKLAAEVAWPGVIGGRVALGVVILVCVEIAFVGLGGGIRDVLAVGVVDEVRDCVGFGVQETLVVVDGVGVAVDEGEGGVDDSVNATPDPTTEPSVVKRIV